MSTSTSAASATNPTSSSSSPSSCYLTPMPILVHVIHMCSTPPLPPFVTTTIATTTTTIVASILQACKAAVIIMNTSHGHKQQQYKFLQWLLQLMLQLLQLLRLPIARTSSTCYSRRVSSSGLWTRHRPTTTSGS